MEYYIESKEIPMYNLLKVFQTNNYNWFYVGYSDDNEDFINNIKTKDKKFENHLMIILGEFNHFGVELWLLLGDYSGLLHKINKYKSNNFINELRDKSLLIVNLIKEENRKIESILNEKIDLKEITLFEWLALRENTV
jgi:hypothetical protein